MADKEMTRLECEMQIMGLLRQIVDVYHKYNPNGTYLTLTYNDMGDMDDYMQFNNSHWDGAEDEDRPINYSDWKGKYVEVKAI